MKKRKLLALLALALLPISSCNSNNSNSINETSNSTFNYVENHRFSDKSTIKMAESSSYNLSLMANEDLTNASFVSSNEKALVIDNNGVIKSFAIDEERVNVKIAIIKDEKIQVIEVLIFDSSLASYIVDIDLGSLYGKSIIFFGDSITDKQYGDNYTNYLNDKCHFSSFSNVGHSGGTMTYKPSVFKNYTEYRIAKNCFPVSVDDNLKTIENSDFVFIMYGVNDISQGDKIDTQSELGDPTGSEAVIDGKTDATFCSSMIYGINKIKSVNPKAIIVFFSIMFSDYGKKYYIKDEKYNEFMEMTCEENNVKYIDVYSLFDESSTQYYKEGNGARLHLNKEGYLVLTDYILNGQKGR
ncbi:MAG: SGNH/GDSL hydrolase family protein [Candidatus Caccosoma sp.]|nr:SGNH/GDSL hydrolase family protein [Candidatus Caccosoma sp.]